MSDDNKRAGILGYIRSILPGKNIPLDIQERKARQHESYHLHFNCLPKFLRIEINRIKGGITATALLRSHRVEADRDKVNCCDDDPCSAQTRASSLSQLSAENARSQLFPSDDCSLLKQSLSLSIRSSSSRERTTVI